MEALAGVRMEPEFAVRKRLTQPFRAWQLAFGFLVLFGPSPALALELDSLHRVRALQPGDFPRAVVLVGDLPPGVSDAEWETAAKAAVATWNAVPCSAAALRYDGRVTRVEDAPAAATTVAFVDADDERCFVSPQNLGFTLLTPCDEWGRTAVLLRTNGVTWRGEPAPYEPPEALAVDVRSVLTHELGHVLGLGHDDVTDPLATMSPRYLRDGGLATLSADDKLALCGLYPSGAGECDAGQRCAGECVTRDGFSVCDEVRVAVGGYCDLADLNCADGASCLVTSPPTFSGYCAAACMLDEECPADMACDDGFCQFVAPRAADGGCAIVAAPRRPAMWLAPIGVMVLRRRRAAGSQGPRGKHLARRR